MPKTSLYKLVCGRCGFVLHFYGLYKEPQETCHTCGQRLHVGMRTLIEDPKADPGSGETEGAQLPGVSDEIQSQPE